MNQEGLDIQLDRARAHTMLQLRLAAKDGNKTLALELIDQFSVDMEKYVNDTCKLIAPVKK